MKVTTVRTYVDANGYSGENFSLYASVEDGKVTKFEINYHTTPTVGYIHLLARDLERFANKIAEVDDLKTKLEIE